MTGPSVKTRALVRHRANDRCEICGRYLKPGEGQTHHRLPRQAGGTRREWVNSAINLLFVCLDCHMWTEANRAESYKLGVLVHQGSDPAAVPVLLLVPGWVLLDVDGDYIPRDRGVTA